MHTFKLTLALISVSLIAGGCATMSAEDCAGADWQTIGLTDGTAGQAPVKADRRANDCAKHGVVMDRNAYERGRDEGLGRYCVEGNAYQLGEQGRSYNGVCANHNEADFLAAYEKGRELHAFTTAASSASSQLATAESRHKELDAKLDKYWNGYRDEGLTMDEHNTMVLELWSEKKYLETEAIPYWRQADAMLSKALSEYRDKVVTNDPSIGSRLRPPSFSGPEPWEGPTEADARAMLQEVFSTMARATGSSD
ncbi:MAG: DUF2799 domain-containing protein [Gammaproteobacteria bacterium]|jgi:hypothetical protein|nr:MAG: DUF2799 domain-containing protein [Gammaproteobacteria bacterium]